MALVYYFQDLQTNFLGTVHATHVGRRFFCEGRGALGCGSESEEAGKASAEGSDALVSHLMIASA